MHRVLLTMKLKVLIDLKYHLRLTGKDWVHSDDTDFVELMTLKRGEVQGK